MAHIERILEFFPGETMELRLVNKYFDELVLALRENRVNTPVIKKKDEKGEDSDSSIECEPDSPALHAAGGEVYRVYRDTLYSARIGKKHLKNFLEENLGDSGLNLVFMKEQINRVRKLTSLNKKLDKTISKPCLFDIPHGVFYCKAWTHFQFESGKMTFADFAKQRGNYEFMKEFWRLNGYSQNVTITDGTDALTFHKAFIDGLAEPEEEEEETKFEFLADDENMNAQLVDFSDPIALARRQRKILEKIQKHISEDKHFDPLRILRQPTVHWVLVLCHGGKFVIQVYENQKMLASKTESKYVMRAKQGGRQATADKGKTIKSLGSQMRRANEKLLQEYIDAHMEAHEEEFKRAHIIFLHAPGFNRNIFMASNKHLEKHAHKVKAAEYATKKATYTEAKELVVKILDAQIIFD